MKIYLAPMEGVLDPVMRALYSKIGGFDILFTEFVRVTDKLLPDRVFYRYSPELKSSGKTGEGLPVYVQLLGGKPTWMAENARALLRLGASGIDLNFGCPAKTVNRHDGGAALLQHPRRLYDIIRAVREAVEDRIPVSAKVRLGYLDKSLATDIARAVDESFASHLIVHARTKLEAYRPPAHWEVIAQMKSAMKNVPIIANGDIWSLNDYLRCREVSTCEDVALGRGVVASPFLAWQIKKYLAGEISGDLPTWSTIQSQCLPYFVSASRTLRGEAYAVTRTKQWTKLLGRQYPQAGELFNEIKTLKTLREFPVELFKSHQ